MNVRLNRCATRVCFVVAIALHTTPTFASAAFNEDPPKAAEPPALDDFWQEPASRLEPIPNIQFDGSRYEATEAEEQAIAALIEQLVEIDKPDYGIAPAMSGSQFAPVKSSQEFGSGIIMVNHGLETHGALLKLVEMGPKALPLLLESLDDATPSKLAMNWNGVMGAMWPAREVDMNMAVSAEVELAAKHKVVRSGMGMGGGFDDHINKHEVTRGDICFLIVGQIVNRNYQPTRYQPTGCMVINSPTRDPEIAAVVRALWISHDPAQTLFTSLIRDLHSRGAASRFQSGAAMRLMYYFPNESRALISDRIDSFDVSRFRHDRDAEGEWNRKWERNGEVGPADFIKAVAFAHDPAIAASILRVLDRTDDPDVFHECVTPQIAAEKPDLLLRRIGEIVAVAPPVDQGPFGGEYHTLRVAAALLPENSRPFFETYLSHNTLECRRAAIHALARPAQPVSWAVDFLTPLLDDTTDTGWQYGPSYDRKPIRVCDEAAQTLVYHIPDTEFVYEGETADLDREIANLKRRIRGEPVAPEPAGEAPIDFAALPLIEPLRSFVFDGRASVYSTSDERTLICGTGYQANCWAYDTVFIDAADGTVINRIKLDEWKGGVSILRPFDGERAFCYNAAGDGLVVIRDIRTGAELGRVQTPFHDWPPGDKALNVRNLSDAALSHDGRWIVALTPDTTLHTINVETGEHKTVWQLAKSVEPDSIGHHGSLLPVQGTNRFIIEFFASDGPLRIWDQDTQTMSTINKVPDGAWRASWGKYALNHLNNHLVLWDLEARKPMTLPIPTDAQVTDVQCVPNLKRAFVATHNGPLYVIDLESLRPLMCLNVPQVDGRAGHSISRDGRLVFWHADLSKYDRETGQSSNQKTHIAIFRLDESPPAN